MAIKFDELLEALDPSLDKFEEDLNSMWIIIPTERRYDDLSTSDYDEFINKYGTFNSRQACWDKIDELAPDRWDAFIPLRIEGVNEAYETDIEIEAKPGDPYNTNEKVISRPEDPYYTGSDEVLNESKSSEALLTEIGNRIASGLRQEGFDSLFDYPGLSVMNTSYGIHIVNIPSILVEDENGKHILTAPINTHNNSTEAVSKIVKTISKSMRK